MSEYGKGHLSSKQVAEWLVEGPSADIEAHVQGCYRCQATLAEQREPLTTFRQAVIGWSERQDAPQWNSADRLSLQSPAHGKLRRWLPAMSFSAAAILMVAFLLGGAMLKRGDSYRVANAGTKVTSDAALMDQVDAEVSETVPDAMSPLTDLVAWDSNEGASPAVAGGKRTEVQGKPSLVTSSKTDVRD